MPSRGADAAAAAVDDVGRGDAAAEEEEVEAVPQRRAAPSGKQRPRRSAGDPGVCQVTECGSGLQGQPPYNRRYRICEAHYRAPCTVIDGVPSRFCQQCGRFHELQAFDADCRSCRKELELHNKRRRRRAAALAAAGLQPSRGRKSGASGGARAASAPRSRAAAGGDATHAALPALHAAAAPYGGMPRGATDIMEQVLGWSALSRGGGGQMGGGQMGGDGAAAHAAAANAGVAAALAAFAARHVGTGASIYGGGGGGGPPGLPGMHPMVAQGLYRSQDGLDGSTAALLAAGWPHGAAGGMAGLPAAGPGGLLLGDMLMAYPGMPPHYLQQPPHPDGGAGAWGAGGT